jgi:hypothetical protein
MRAYAEYARMKYRLMLSKRGLRSRLMLSKRGDRSWYKITKMGKFMKTYIEIKQNHNLPSVYSSNA